MPEANTFRHELTSFASAVRRAPERQREATERLAGVVHQPRLRPSSLASTAAATAIGCRLRDVTVRRFFTLCVGVAAAHVNFAGSQHVPAVASTSCVPLTIQHLTNNYVIMILKINSLTFVFVRTLATDRDSRHSHLTSFSLNDVLATPLTSLLSCW